MWRNSVLLAGAGVFALLGPALAQTSDRNTGSNGMSGRVSSADMKFAKEAASGGMAEVELGKLATQKASNDKVKSFGQRMIDDHGKANDQLKSLASKDNITLPTEMDAKDRATVDRLSKLSGTEFDRAYMRDMVQDHQKDIAAFQKEASSGSNMDLKNWASSTVPTLQDHLRQAKEAESAVGSMTSR
jgi:putative membrane protein